MLSRTASALFWTGRYIERADFVSRLIDATIRLAALPSSYGGDVAAWSGALAAAGARALRRSLVAGGALGSAAGAHFVCSFGSSFLLSAL